ncbi:TRAP transporter small permease [Thalassospira sp. NFXS8]|jgi:TRAP-type C4-dicarboxylate transport system permease small subunit|uniref:TRAP transporter small permease n=1 Tax=Thalassospira sp. NFXS8 TaxID=2819093 RepID=UPI0032DFACDD
MLKLSARFLNLLDWSGRIATAVLMTALMAITFTDVVGRQFGHPIAFAFEFTQMTVGAMFYIGLPLVTMRGEHIAVDLVPIRPNGPVGIVVVAMVDLLCAFLVAIVARQLWQQAQTLDMFNTVMMFTRWPLAPIVRAMAVMAALTSLICLLQGFARSCHQLHHNTTEQEP